MASKFLILLSTVLALLLLGSCSSKNYGASPGDPSDGSDDSSEDDRGYDWICGKPTVKFEDIDYVHPDSEKLIESIEQTKAVIEKDDMPAEKQLEMLEQSLRLYSKFETMRSHAEIRFASDRENESARAEFSELYRATPKIELALYRLMICIDRSENGIYFKDKLSSSCLLPSANEDTELTDEVTELLTKEADTVCKILTFSEKDAGEDNFNSLITELFLIRAGIAEEMGFDSYCDYFHGTRSDFSSDEISSLLESITEYSLPVYRELEPVFDRYFATHTAPFSELILTIPYLGKLYSSTDSVLGESFAHMIGGGLFGIKDGEGRSDPHKKSSFLTDYGVHYVFIDSSETLADYMTVARAFGRFSAGHIAGGNVDGALSSISAEAVRMITLASLYSRLPSEDYKFLLYNELDLLFSELINAAYFAKLEYEIYSLPVSQINEETIVKTADKLAKEMGIDAPSLMRSAAELIVISPFESAYRCIALASGLEVFLSELEEPGAGLGAYRELFRQDSSTELDIRLIGAGLCSPFEEGYLKKMSNRIHYIINGSIFFEENDEPPGKT